jgi:beta-lactamase regulating signal transducer with metallopeptidase domain
VYLFYLVFLRRLTFYSWNRWYLLLYSMVCFIIPFVNIFQLFSEPALQQSPIVQYIPSIEEMTIPHTHAWVTEPAFTMNIIYIVVIMAGMLFMLGRCLVQFYSFFRMRAKAKLLYDNKVKLYHIDKPVVPFSFGNAIYINQHQHSQQELSEIIRHEFIHVKQRHTVDMLWSELLCIVNWYNPFAWLLRKAIRQNLEFIADHQVLQSGLDRKQYQYLLLKVIGTAEFSIASKFNFSSLKKRIAMMNKTKSARVNLLRFAFILPLLAVILLAFRNVVQQKPQPLPQPLAKPALIIDTVPARKTYTMPDNVRNMEVEYRGTKTAALLLH